MILHFKCMLIGIVLIAKFFLIKPIPVSFSFKEVKIKIIGSITFQMCIDVCRCRFVHVCLDLDMLVTVVICRYCKFVYR